VVYDYSWLTIAFPLRLLIGDVIAGFGITAAEFSLHSAPVATATNIKVLSWIIACATLTLSLNAVCTGAALFDLT
jgi:hypothetical protein